MERPVIMKDIAAAAGVSLMTVSYALRHHPSIPQVTRDRIHKIAEEMGYTKSPLISALMTHLRSQRPIKDMPLIAYISSYSDRRTMMANPFRRAYFEGAEARAESLGFRLELFLTDEYKSRGDKRLSEVLRYRNVQGVIMGISPLKSPPVNLDWPSFASCVIGNSDNYPGLHHVDGNNTQMIRLALRRLQEKGYQKIGMLCGAFEHRRVEGAVAATIAGYNHSIPPAKRIPFEILPPHRWNPKTMAAWVRQRKIEVLITQSHTPYLFLLEAGFKNPSELATITLEYSPNSNLSGIDQRPRQLGASAVDLIHNQLAQNLRGIPAMRRTLLLDGVWIDGNTAPGLTP